jgi:hypothetical protein
LGVALVPSKAVQVAAVGATAEVARRSAAAPSFSDLAAKFGKQGLKYDDRGQVNGYKYPTPKDDTDRKRINNAVYEMWNPQRKIAVQMGGEHSAKIPAVTLLDRKTGRRDVVPEHLAEGKARKLGMVEAPRRVGVKYAIRNGKSVCLGGRNGRGEIVPPDVEA